MNTSVGFVIPTKNAGARWARVVDAIVAQQGVTLSVLVVDSGSTDATVAQAKAAGFWVIEIAPNEFGHGRTRQFALEQLPNCELVVFLTQDSVLAAVDSVRLLLTAFNDPRVAVAYGRQLPHEDATPAAQRLREFNYPAQSFQRSYADRAVYGLKAAFNSNSFSAYRRDRLVQVGGFEATARVGEDILACASLLRAGYHVAYVATAQVFHSHNYSLVQEFARYRDIGHMHAMFPQLLKEFGQPEGEGIRLVKREVRQTIARSPFQAVGVIVRAAVRYAGYRVGRRNGASHLCSA